MSTITIDAYRKLSSHNPTARAKVAASYLAAHLTAVSTVGCLYLLGLFDVGFLSPQSLAAKILGFLLTVIGY